MTDTTYAEALRARYGWTQPHQEYRIVVRSEFDLRSVLPGLLGVAAGLALGLSILALGRRR